MDNIVNLYIERLKRRPQSDVYVTVDLNENESIRILTKHTCIPDEYDLCFECDKPMGKDK